MDFVKLLVTRYFTDVLGMKYVEERENALLFIEGFNKVAVGVYAADFYEESELYKKVGALAGLDAVKIYLAVLPSALPYIDAKYFKNVGVGLVVVDVDKGVDGVDVKIFPKPRQTSTATIDTEKVLEVLRTQLLNYIESQIKRIENSLYEKLKNYIDQKIAEVKKLLTEFNQTGVEIKRLQPESSQTGASQTSQPNTLLSNDWVRILRSKSGG